MTLTKEQIAYLFKFCEKHYVYHYDVQVELVDHLANAIELEMSRDEKISFNHALDHVYAGFGVMGFAPIVREKSEQVRRMAKKQYWAEVANQLKWPQAVAFFLAVAFFYTVTVESLNLGLLFLGLAGVGGPVYLLVCLIRDQRILKKSGKKFLSINNYHINSGVCLPLYIMSQLVIHRPDISPFLLSLITGVYLLTTVAAYRVTHKMKEKLINDYPEVFQISN